MKSTSKQMSFCNKNAARKKCTLRAMISPWAQIYYLYEVYMY